MGGGCPHRTRHGPAARRHRRELRNRSGSSRRGDGPRYQGPNWVRGRSRATADRRAPRAGEARAHEVAGVLEGSARPVLWRPAPRRPVLRSLIARHRSADHELTDESHRRDSGKARSRPVPGSGYEEPVLDDGPFRRHLRRRESALDRGRGSRIRPGRCSTVNARRQSGKRSIRRRGQMVVTTRVRLDRIASSTRNAGLSPEVIVGDDIIAGEGYVLAVRIVADKPTYNTVEDVTGRMLELRAGDVLAGVLGTRRALRGYAGVVPGHISVGDTIDVLNLGGILGQCTSMNPDVGPPFRAEVLGAILVFPALGDRVGRPAHISDHAVPTAETLEHNVPVVYVAGTCMNAGKTIAATELVRGLTRGGLT